MLHVSLNSEPKDSQSRPEKNIEYTTGFEIGSIDMTSTGDPQSSILGVMTSISESLENSIEVVTVDVYQNNVERRNICKIEYPPSRVMWNPQSTKFGQDQSLMAVASDKLRLYSYSEQSGITYQTELRNTMLKDLSGPLTSFDWSARTNFICCSSIDTTCSIFDINEGKFFKQLIAHDKEVL